MERPSTLHVDRVGGAIRYRFEASQRHRIDVLEGFLIQPVRDDELAEAHGKAMALLRSRPSPTFPAEANARGRILYSALVPPQLRDDLAAVRGSLLVSTTTSLPFELFFDEEFWGLRYALGRQLLLEGRQPRRAERHPSTRLRALILCSDPRDDVPFVRREAELIFESLASLAEVDLIDGAAASFDTVANALGGAYDIIHYCGHVVAQGSSSGLLLAGGRVLSSSTIGRVVNGSPVVFLNGCASSRTDSARTSLAWEHDTQTVTHAFALGGARAVVGTASDVGDAEAAAIAVEFYLRAIAGEPLGESLRQARWHGRTHTPDSPSWLSFVLHGDPTVRLVGDRGIVVVDGTAATLRPVEADMAPDPRPKAHSAPRRTRHLLPWAGAFALVIALGVSAVRQTDAFLYLETYQILLSAPAEAGCKRVVEIAERFHRQGRLETALWFQKRALILTERLRGARAVETATQQNNVADVYRRLGHPEHAVPLYRAAIETMQQISASPSARARVASNLGLALDALGRFDESERSHRQALALHRDLPDRILAEVYNNLGLLERHRGDTDAALRWYQRARRIYVKSIGTDNTGYITSLNNMCALYADPKVQRIDLAEASCREAAKRARAYLPPEHPQRRTTHRNLIEVLRRQGRELEAGRLEYDTRLR